MEVGHQAGIIPIMPRLPPLPDWSAIDTVLLDMDGTILDLKFDNHFWRELVPSRYAAANALTVVAAKQKLEPMFAAKQGTLDWYCIDYWSRELQIDISALNREAQEHVTWAPEAERFVLRLRALGKRLALVTNAHGDTLAVKDAQLDFRGHFDAVYSSHSFGTPKETLAFWERLIEVEPFDRERTLFVDDSLPVLRAARAFGIGWLYAIAHPDSSRPRREIDEFPAVNHLHELT
jgi:putative hydrolase of the HAD superfamily